MRKKSLLFTLIVAFASIVPISCKKNGTINYNFEGKVVRVGTGDALSGVSVRIGQQLILNNTTTDGYTIAGSAETGSTGEYAIEFERKKVTEFELKFRKDNYFPITQIISTGNTVTGSPNKIDKAMEPMSWIQFEFFNSFPAEDDHFRLVTHNFREGCEGCLENTSTNYFGSLDTIMLVPTTADRYTKFTIINVTTGYSKTDSLYTTAFETIPYTFEY
jgi:hypothetical protein